MGILKIKTGPNDSDWTSITNLNLGDGKITTSGQIVTGAISSQGQVSGASLSTSGTLSAGATTLSGLTKITGNLEVGSTNGSNEIYLNGQSLGQVIEDSAVTVYIHVNSNGNNSYTSSSPSGSGTTLMGWFNNTYPANSASRAKAIKGLLIEHRTISTGTYHIPHYWTGSGWTPLHAIWG